jgi:hypothetical protein
MLSRVYHNMIQVCVSSRGVDIIRYIYVLQDESEIKVRVLQHTIIKKLGTAKDGALFIWSCLRLELELLDGIDYQGGYFSKGYNSCWQKLHQQFTYAPPRWR